MASSSGGPPTEAQVLALAKRMRSIDDEDDETHIDPLFLDISRGWLTEHPKDDNFTLDIAPGEHPGVATCMETDCYVDIPLIKDSRLPDGGIARGVGSLAPLAYHCQEPAHVAGRDARWRGLENKARRDAKLAKAKAASGSLGGSQDAAEDSQSRCRGELDQRRAS